MWAHLGTTGGLSAGRCPRKRCMHLLTHVCLYVNDGLYSYALPCLTKPKDFIVFNSTWNTGGLGWRTNLKVESLKKKSVLHWNGQMKPWKPGGLYQELWQPHREKFDTLQRPYEDDSSEDSLKSLDVPEPSTDRVLKKQSDSNMNAEATNDMNTPRTAEPVREAPARVTRTRPITTSPSPQQVAARKACPQVRLVDEWLDSRAKLGSSADAHSSAPVLRGDNPNRLQHQTFKPQETILICCSILGRSPKQHENEAAPAWRDWS